MGTFLEAVRSIVSPDIPIVATLDFHANLTDIMVQTADGLFGYNIYPHVDGWERAKFTELLDSGFIDTFRHFYPDKTEAYTWWSYMFSARANNVGWRIDYFCVSSVLKDSLKSATIHADIMGSDHCPVGSEL